MRVNVGKNSNPVSVNVADQNNVSIDVNPVNQVRLEITPQPRIEARIDRGVAGPTGPPGPNNIGGYPISVSSPSNYDALMFLDNEWTNVPQVEITDGGNF